MLEPVNLIVHVHNNNSNTATIGIWNNQLLLFTIINHQLLTIYSSISHTTGKVETTKQEN